MKIIQAQIVNWDRLYNFQTEEEGIKAGDLIIVKTDSGKDIARVERIIDEEEGKALELSEDPILRMATVDDLEKVPDKKTKEEALFYAISLKEKYDLPMKFVDVHFSFDRTKIIFAFIADGRVDFREMVKDLTRHFNKSIRLQQIGIRDEAKICGDCGHCGKTLCCKTHLKELASITSEMAEIQECSHRGSERISGVCGRLLCCLAYEQKGYEDLLGKMPPLGSRVNVDGKKGIVVGLHPLRRSVDVEFSSKENKDKTVMEIDLDRHKK